MSTFEKRSLTALAVLLCSGVARLAAADVTVMKSDEWEFYTNGRVQAFATYTNGDTYPEALTNSNGESVEIQGGGVKEQSTTVAPGKQGKHQSFRVRSGFTGTELGFGVKRNFSPTTQLRSYVLIQGVIESTDRRKYEVVKPDLRMSYMELSGPWGSFLAGRALTLFSRGATEITYLYGFKYGVGFGGGADVNGPTAGHIGFGVLANGFAPGFKYETPLLGGLRLAAGLYDPAGLVGTTWARTKYPRPEAEVSYDLEFNGGLVHLFVNGAWQKLYQSGTDRDTTASGAGYGARVEVGPVHLGVAGHYGTGLGISYALEPSAATAAQPGQGGDLRTFDGYYAQLQVALGKLDLQAGWGITRVKLLDKDKGDFTDDDDNPLTPPADDDDFPGVRDPFSYNLLKHQMGISAGVVYHLADNFHFDVDYFRADMRWYLAEQKQVLNYVSSGVTMDW